MIFEYGIKDFFIKNWEILKVIFFLKAINALVFRNQIKKY